MATQDAYSSGAQATVEALTGTAIKTRVGTLERRRQHGADRSRRVLVKWLRRTAKRAHDTDPIRRRREALLHYRAAAVRTDLLEIAAMLERAHKPNPACVATLHELLANGCDSPLYNPDVHISELHATLHHIRVALGDDDAPTPAALRKTAARHAPPVAETSLRQMLDPD